MEGGEENREKFNLSMRMNGFSSDLLKNFMKRRLNPNGQEEEEDEVERDEEIELSLGLSMNGRFGVDPMKKKLKRSSSISNLVFTVGTAENGGTPQARVVEFDRYAPLSRTRSLPTEAEEEWRRRKEFQSMRRMEARKKRMEKLKNVRVMKDKDICLEDVKNGSGLGEVINGVINSENGNEISSSQGSIGSQRSGSSGISDIDFHPKDGPKPNAESPVPSQDVMEEELARRAGDRDVKLSNNLLKNAMIDMPYVSTRGDGPNGHRVEGFLYRYKKGEEVRIVCVCHGMFLTPAEFVKHGGGGDVEHPLKHIVVNPFPLL